VPVKRKPIKSERITSLSKLLRSQVQVAFENIPHWHERDLSNSANERFILPMCSILLDEMIETMINVIQNLHINANSINKNLYVTKGQIFAEFLLKALIKKGIPRFKAYRDVQRIAFEAHDKGIEYIDAVKKDKSISSQITEKEIKTIFTPENHLGSSSSIINNVSKSVQNTCKKFI
ncbi:MAG: adenylosuccinate lyase, partial [Nitrosopumilaceae archaeon]